MEIPVVLIIVALVIILGPLWLLAMRGPPTPVEVIDKELKEITRMLGAFRFDGYEAKDDPTIAMFNELLKQKATLQAALVEIAKKG